MARACLQVWRYYLLSVRPEQQDTDFKWADLQVRMQILGMRSAPSYLPSLSWLALAMACCCGRCAQQLPPHTHLLPLE